MELQGLAGLLLQHLEDFPTRDPGAAAAACHELIMLFRFR